MSHQTDPNLIHCNNCEFEGKAKSTGTGQFFILIGMLVFSAFFLPLIVAALAYMVWILAQPPKRFCPKCKSADYVPLETAPVDKSESLDAISTKQEQV